MFNEPDVIQRTSKWLDDVVIGLNLCPFAKAPRLKGQVRYSVSLAQTTQALLADLERELLALTTTKAAEVETTLLIHPHVLQDFADYNDFLSEADGCLQKLELEGVLQIASFHPDYCFAGSPPNDAANYTNRSPYPMLHLLREASITRAVEGCADPSTIYERNMALLRGLSPAELALLVPDPESKQT